MSNTNQAAPKTIVTLETLNNIAAQGGLDPALMALLAAAQNPAAAQTVQPVTVLQSDYDRKDGSASYYAKLAYGASGRSSLSLSRPALKALFANLETLKRAFEKIEALEGPELIEEPKTNAKTGKGADGKPVRKERVPVKF